MASSARVGSRCHCALNSVEPSGPSLDELIAAVRAAGYDAAELQGGQAASAAGDEEEARRALEGLQLMGQAYDEELTALAGSDITLAWDGGD